MCRHRELAEPRLHSELYKLLGSTEIPSAPLSKVPTILIGACISISSICTFGQAAIVSLVLTVLPSVLCCNPPAWPPVNISSPVGRPYLNPIFQPPTSSHPL